MSRELTNQVLILDGREFAIQAIIGRGASCVVYRAECPDKTEHLLKEYNPRHIAMYRESTGELCLESEEDREEFEAGLVRFREGHTKQRELRLDSDLKNSTSNVQGIYEANGTEYIDMTCFNGKTYDQVQEKSVYDLLHRMKALAQVIGNYHKAGLLHLDIKPENIFTLPETCEMVMLFDFDSVVSRESAAAGGARSYTLSWAAPEQTNPLKRNTICEATDIFSVGEMIFCQLMGRQLSGSYRHSTTEERLSFAEYHFDRNLPIFENLNPKVFPMLEELLHKTICVSIKQRYKSTIDLIAALDEIIAIANPQKPYLKNSPFAVQDFFVGRDSEIQEIHRRLNENNILFLNGIGGIGKSELAKRYALKYKADYDAIIFAPYVSDVNMLLQDDHAIPLYNFEPRPEEKPEDYCARKLKKLSELCDERTLFILDNLDRENDPNIGKLLNLGCKILITTRRDFSGFGKPQLYVDKLASTKKIREIFDQYYKVQNEEESACVDKIIATLEGHTMAVELVAKQIEAEWATADEILIKLKDSGVSGIGDSAVDSGKDGLNSRSTFAHIKALFDLTVFQQNENALYVLSNLALIPHTGIDRKLFAEWSELSQHGGNTVANDLIKAGWIRQDKLSKTISLHPVVADVIGKELHDHQFRTLLSNFSMFISNESDDYTDHVFGQQTQYLIWTLTYKFTEFLIKTDIDAPYICDVLYKIGGVLYDYSDYVNCEKVWIKVSADYERRGSCKDIAEIQCSLALLYAEIGRLEKDEDMILRAIESYQHSLPIFGELGDWDSLATIYNNIGSAYHDLNRYEEAVSMYQHSIECHNLQSEKGARYFSSVAICHNNIGVLYKDMQLYRQATKSYRDALALLETQPWNTIDNALIRHNLAVVLYKKNSDTYDLCQAKKCVEEALSIRRNIFPNGNISIAQSEELLARILMEYDTENTDTRAEALLISAQKPFFDYYGEDHEETVRLLKGLTVVRAKLYGNKVKV